MSIPSWETWKLAHAYPRIGSGTTPTSNNENYYSIDYGVPWVTTAELRENYISSTASQVTDEALHDFSALRIYEPGSVMIAMYGATIGRLGITKVPATCNQACCVFEKSEQFDNRFLFYWLWHRRSDLISLSTGGGQPNLSQQDLKEERALCPPIDLQHRIVKFLDEKTARIDRLIEKKCALLDRLAEKRQALITHAVTKGLNPDATMKPSGIDWLGRIPEHWDIKRMKFLGKTRYGLAEPPEKNDEGVPFIRATDIYRGSVDLSGIQRVSIDKVDLKRKPKLRIGEILVVRSGAYTGDSAIVTRDLEGFIAGYDMVFTSISANSEFIAFVLLSKFMLEGQIYLARQRAAQPHLNSEELGDFITPVPPINEQINIANYLLSESKHQYFIQKKIEHSIEYLNQYRSALITSAVTGKLDIA